MKPTDSQNLEEAKVAFVREFNRQQMRAALSLALTFAVAYILYRGFPPPWNGAALGFGSALYMTGFLILRPNSLRSRTGSKLPAIGLVAFLWAAAILVSVISFIGARTP